MNNNTEILNSNNDNIDLNEIKNDNFEDNNDILGEEPTKKLKEEEKSEIDFIPETQESIMEKRKRVTEIRNWINHPRLGRHLDEYKVIELGSLSITQLENMLAEIKYLVNTKNNTNNVENAFKCGTVMIENVANKFTNMDLTGYSLYINSDDQILDTVAEISMSYQDLTYCSPEKRLLFSLISGALVVNSINKNKKTLQQTSDFLNRAVATQLETKYNDL